MVIDIAKVKDAKQDKAIMKEVMDCLDMEHHLIDEQIRWAKGKDHFDLRYLIRASLFMKMIHDMRKAILANDKEAGAIMAASFAQITTNTLVDFTIDLGIAPEEVKSAMKENPFPNG
jgi:hypothetical protein